MIVGAPMVIASELLVTGGFVVVTVPLAFTVKLTTCAAIGVP